MIFRTQCKKLNPFLFADDANCLYVSQGFLLTEFIHVLNWNDYTLVFKNTEKFCTKNVIDLGILPYKNLSYVSHFQRVSSKLAKHIWYHPYELIHQ